MTYLTYERALEIIKNNMPAKSGFVDGAIILIEFATKKQIPKKPDLEGDGCDDDGNTVYDTWFCPHCHKDYEVYYDNYKFCPNCGQAIDWSE